MARKITILGMGPTAYERKIDILKYVEDTEIWSLNNAYNFYPHLKGRWSRFYELHLYDYLKTWNPGHDGCHFKALDELRCPIIVGQPLPIIDMQERYPWISIFEHHNSNYFLGSPSLMLAQALFEHDKGNEIEEIRSYGIDTSDPTHGQQRQSWAWWLRGAHERGIRLTGTSTNFFAEHENDDGLRGIREEAGGIIIRNREEQL